MDKKRNTTFGKTSDLRLHFNLKQTKDKDKLTQIFESKNWTVGLSEGKLSLNLNKK